MKKEKPVKEKKVKTKMDSKKKKKVIRWSILGSVVVLVLGGVIVSKAMSGDKKMPVQVVKITKEDIEQTLSASGNVQSEITRNFFPPADARIDVLNVSLGDSVKKGDVLLTYNADSLAFSEQKAALQQSSSTNGYRGTVADSQEQETKYQEAENMVVALEPMVESQKLRIKQGESYLEDMTSRDKVDLYNKQYSLTKEMNGLNEEAQSDMTDMSEDARRQRQHDISQARLKVQNELDTLSHKLKLMEEDAELTEIEREIVEEKNILTDLEKALADNKAIRDSAEPQVLNEYEKSKLKADAEIVRIEAEKAKKDLEDAKNGVTAEFDGIVTELGVVEGGFVSESTQVLKLESTESVKISFQVTKYDLEKIKVGQSADITVSGHEYKGTVSKINRMATTNAAGSQVVSAEVHIDNPDDNIYLGVEGKVRVSTATVRGAVAIPVELVNADIEGDFCFVVENDVVAKRRLKTGISSDSMIEVLEGLKEGDQVIASGTISPEEGTPVTVIPEVAPTEAATE